MKSLLLTLLLWCSTFSVVFGSAANLQDVWKALEAQDRKLARTLLDKAIKQPDTQLEASIALLYLDGIEGKESSQALIQTVIDLADDPSPYLHALWDEDAFVGNGVQHDKKTIAFLKSVMESKKINESIRAALGYALGTKYLYSNDLDGAKKQWKSVSAIKDWQIVGNFDNASQSGFDKNYPPVTSPKPDAKFKSTINADIFWFEPKYPQNAPWVTVSDYIAGSQGIVYAQSFVESPVEQEAILALGGNGSLKVWVNDQLVLQQEEEQTTELDIAKRPVTLQQGVNRILVQVGYTDNIDDPCFMVRLLDQNHLPIAGLKTSATYSDYKAATAAPTKEAIPHFAETYFSEKIKKEPNNVLNYILLAQSFLRRGAYNKTIESLNEGLKVSPNNPFLKNYLLLSYVRNKDRTELLKQIEEARTLDPTQFLIAAYDFEVSMSKKNYTDADKYLQVIKNYTGEKSTEYLSYYIRLLSAKEDIQELHKVVDIAYSLHPEHSSFLSYKYQLLKENAQTANAARILLENNFKSNYNYQSFSQLVEDYLNVGNIIKAERMLLEQIEFAPESLQSLRIVVNFYYQTKNYSKALQYVKRGLSNSPFSASLWQDRAYIHEGLEEKEEAIKALEKAIHYNPNLFESREKLRELQGKKPVSSYFPRQEDMLKLVENAVKEKETESDESYEYLFYDKTYIIYPEGTSVEYATIAVKMLDQSSLETWSESNIPVSGMQDLTVEKAQVIKKNGQKTEAERQYNHLVFPSLEVGDAIYIAYRIENTTGGKLSKEFWDNWVANHFVPMRSSKLRVFAPKDYNLHFNAINLNLEPQQTTVDEFKCYEWNISQPAKCRDEKYMPNLEEVGMVLNMSSTKSWKTISDWYRDLAMPMAKEDYNLIQTYNKIFEGKTFNSDYDKAKAIYDYLCDNIRYSSVSFRQSNFVPQKPMVTLSTQLGDCKDLSTLYYTLAKKAGITTHLVLVNTRDNGETALHLPTTNFNHCIVKIDLKDREMYQELTNSKLPFGAVPNGIAQSQALIIPNTANDPVGTELIKIPDHSSVKNQLSSRSTIKINDKQLQIQLERTAKGETAARFRYHYGGLTKEMTRERIQNMVGENFTGGSVKINSYQLDNLDNRDKDIFIKSDFTVDNSLITIGGMKAVKPPFFESVFTANAFQQEETRKHPLVYSQYEPNSYYETVLIFEIPAGTKFVEMPQNINIKNSYIQYDLITENTSPTTLKLTRKVSIINNTLPPDQFAAFQETVKAILKAEDQYVAYK